MTDRFTVIEGGKDTEYNKEIKLEQLYMKAFSRELAVISSYNSWNNCRDNLKRAVFYAVKYYGLQRVDHKYSVGTRTKEEINNDFNLMECVKMLMGQLTAREIMSMFPITKEYDGEKWKCKDYYFTIEKLKDYDLDSPLGQDGLEDFLWDYWNHELFAFDATAMSIASNMYRLQTGKGIMETWLEKQNIPSYTFNDEIGVMQNRQTGEIMKISTKPSHLQIVK